MDGGERIAGALERHGTRFLFTLCGGHIAPILVGCKRRGIRVVDVRHEATAVFAADAVARLGGGPGVAAVTAGPGATNTVTPLVNARLAQSPLLLLVGAAPTVLRGRGALQDIDQRALLRPNVKRWMTVRRVRDLAAAVDAALGEARAGVPGPVAVECPVDLLYPEALVREWYGGKQGAPAGPRERLLRWYLSRHLARMFGGSERQPGPAAARAPLEPGAAAVRRAAERIRRAERPLILAGSQAVAEPAESGRVAEALGRIGLPAYLSGMARGLLGAAHPLQRRHARREALREADLVVLAGVPCDFRLDYGRHLSRRSFIVAANRSRADLVRNRRPDLGLAADPGLFLARLAAELGTAPSPSRADWLARLGARDAERDAEIRREAETGGAGVNPVRTCLEVEAALEGHPVLVADGGDFVGTAAYVVRPRGALGWLDPGVFGTLGVGAGFALAAKLCRPAEDVWLLWGDGACGYGLAEIDSFARHGLGVVAVVGNDAGWTQIAREQLPLLGDDVGCALGRTDYHVAAEGLGGAGFRVESAAELGPALAAARGVARAGRPALVNVTLGRSEFRKGSISM